MVVLNEVKAFADSYGNEIRFTGEPITLNIVILFRGKNNILVVDSAARIKRLNLRFDCDGGKCVIGSNVGVAPLQAAIRVGQDSSVNIGNNVSTTNLMQVSAVEGSSVIIGNDTMIAGNVKIRGDDGHPIFDVATGLRVNPALPIEIGNHVWLGIDSTILGGSTIGDGSVVGTKSLVKGQFPNNCIIAGVPARVLRRDIAWERPHLSIVPPFYKPDASTVTKSPYWNFTETE